MVARKFPRFAVQLPVTFTIDGQEGKGTILNISREGCMITSERELDSSQYLSLGMELLEKERPVSVNLAAVRWVSKQRIGLEYIKISPTDSERLRRFVDLLDIPRVDSE